MSASNRTTPPRNHTTPNYQHILVFYIIYLVCGGVFWLSDGPASIVTFAATTLIQTTVMGVYNRLVHDQSDGAGLDHLLSVTTAATAIGFSFAARGCESP